jgi:urocanate hydratase
MGGAQPLAVTMNEGVALVIEVDEARASRRHDIGYVDRVTNDPGQALQMARTAAEMGQAVSIALVGNAAEIEPAWAKAGERFDAVTDQTSAHDALAGYVPAEIALPDALALRQAQPDEYQRRSRASMAAHVRAMLAFQDAGAVVFDYGNNLRAQARDAGVADAFDYPGFVPAFIRPQFEEGRGPFRWVALSGDPADILRTDRAILELFPDDASLARWIRLAEERVPFQGLPARICWLGYGERARAGQAFNELVRTGEVSAPIVIGRDHLDSGSVASPNRETEAMRDGTDAVADWPLLNALVNTAAGATWVSIHHGGGVGIGYSQHAGMVVVADGTELAARKLERVLTTDPAMGVIRHADAGYEHAIEVARERGVRLPMLDDRG